MHYLVFVTSIHVQNNRHILMKSEKRDMFSLNSQSMLKLSSFNVKNLTNHSSASHLVRFSTKTNCEPYFSPHIYIVWLF